MVLCLCVVGRRVRPSDGEGAAAVVRERQPLSSPALLCTAAATTSQAHSRWLVCAALSQTYRSLLSTTAAARSDLFSSFGSKISGIISSCIRPVLDSLAVQPGILLVLCCQSDSFGSYNIDASTSSTSSLSPNPGSHSRERLIIAQPYPSAATAATSTVLSSIPTLERLHSDEYRSLKKKHGVLAVSEVHDTYSVLSAHDALLSLGSEILSVYQDGVASVELKGRDSHVWMQRWHEQRNSFIVVYQSYMEQHVKHSIAQTAHLLHKGQTSSTAQMAACGPERWPALLA